MTSGAVRTGAHGMRYFLLIGTPGVKSAHLSPFASFDFDKTVATEVKAGDAKLTPHDQYH